MVVAGRKMMRIWMPCFILIFIGFTIVNSQLPENYHNFDYWTANNCLHFRKLFDYKLKVMQRCKLLQDSYEARANDDKLDEFSVREAKIQLKILNLFASELNGTQNLLLFALNGMDNFIIADFRDLKDLQKNSKDQLLFLKDAVVKKEQEFNSMDEIEKLRDDLQTAIIKDNLTSNGNLFQSLMDHVIGSADKLEDSLKENAFENAVADTKGNNKIEAVVKINEGGSSNVAVNNTNPNNADDSGVPGLIDSQSNRYILSKGKDTTVPHEDRQLIRDLVEVFLLSFVFSTICYFVGLPTMFGYIVTGVVLGPSGCNRLMSLVQIETIGEFGVFFILFSVGLEFSPKTIRDVWKVSVVGSGVMMVLMIVVGICLGLIVTMPAQQSSFIATCLSLSSTPLIVKFIEAKAATTAGRDKYERPLLGILIMQDVYLGLIIAMLPVIATYSEATSAAVYALIALKELGALVAVLVLTVVCGKLVFRFLLPFFKRFADSEVNLLLTVALLFAFLMITYLLNISMELGCFLAGVAISAQSAVGVDEIQKYVHPIKDYLSCIFFASIGLHIFPKFLFYEVFIVVVLTMMVVAFKFLSGVILLHFLLPQELRSSKYVMSAGLAQVSEFAFVLGSRARRLGLISREIYLLILSLTTLSLLLAPLLWRIAVWHLKRRQSSNAVDSKSLSEMPLMIDQIEEDGV